MGLHLLTEKKKAHLSFCLVPFPPRQLASCLVPCGQGLISTPVDELPLLCGKQGHWACSQNFWVQVVALPLAFSEKFSCSSSLIKHGDYNAMPTGLLGEDQTRDIWKSTG